MKRQLAAASIALLAATALFATGAHAELNMRVGINLPNVGISVSTTPEVVVVPGTYVYFAPDLDDDLFFYRGYWYKPHKGGWYRSEDLDSGWVVISIGKVPSPVLHIGPGFRDMPPGLTRIPYGQLKKNWRSWEKERRWDNEHHARRGNGKHKKHRHND